MKSESIFEHLQKRERGNDIVETDASCLFSEQDWNHLFRSLVLAREETDTYYAQKPPKGVDSGSGISFEKLYPVGCCHLIRDRVFDTLRKIGVLDYFIQKYGGLAKSIYGIYEDSCFQNAIQLGGLVLDVAEDSVYGRDGEMKVFPLKNAPFENLDSYGRFAEISEKYRGSVVVPNVYFPEISYLYPVLSYNPRNEEVVTVDGHCSSIQGKDLLGVGKERFERSDYFFRESRYASRRLSGKQIDAVSRQMKKFDCLDYFDPTGEKFFQKSESLKQQATLFTDPEKSAEPSIIERWNERSLLASIVNNKGVRPMPSLM